MPILLNPYKIWSYRNMSRSFIVILVNNSLLVLVNQISYNLYFIKDTL